MRMFHVLHVGRLSLSARHFAHRVATNPHFAKPLENRAIDYLEKRGWFSCISLCCKRAQQQHPTSPCCFGGGRRPSCGPSRTQETPRERAGSAGRALSLLVGGGVLAFSRGCLLGCGRASCKTHNTVRTEGAQRHRDADTATYAAGLAAGVGDPRRIFPRLPRRVEWRSTQGHAET
jgi:hypothetical protein